MCYICKAFLSIKLLCHTSFIPDALPCEIFWCYYFFTCNLHLASVRNLNNKMADKIVCACFWNFLFSAIEILLFLKVILMLMVHWQIVFSVVYLLLPVRDFLECIWTTKIFSLRDTLVSYSSMYMKYVFIREPSASIFPSAVLMGILKAPVSIILVTRHQSLFYLWSTTCIFCFRKIFIFFFK